jgi:hypothetical protein
MYDNTLGVPFFVGTRRAFEEHVRRYGINFRSAVDIGGSDVSEKAGQCRNRFGDRREQSLLLRLLRWSASHAQ